MRRPALRNRGGATELNLEERGTNKHTKEGREGAPAPVFSHEARLQLLSRGQFHLPLDILAQSNRGRKLCAFSRYCLYRPCFTTVTIPTLRSTRRCLEAVGCVIFMRPTISLTVQYLPLFRSPISSRRFASAIALKTSVVVAALAMRLRSSRIALER
jgi:hypothetical protein